MPDFADKAGYGERIADKYDQWYGAVDEEMVEKIYEVGAGGSAFELGIGTGRIALPLQKRGMQVGGIDASPSMLEKLKSKEGGDKIEVQTGDFSSFSAPGKYDVVFAVFNTFFALTTQEEQVNCLQCVQKILAPGGKLILELFVPDLKRFEGGQAVRVSEVKPDQVKLDCSTHDPLRQIIISQTVDLSGMGIGFYPVKLRYVWPAELDLMARLASLELESRWGSWRGDPFTSKSGIHISTYKKQGE